MSSATGTFTPRPGAAGLAAMILAQARIEARLLLRNGEQVLLALVIPLVLLVAGTAASIVDLGPGRRVDVLVPGVIALAVLSTSFTSVAIATGYERRYGVLKRLGASPLPRFGLLAGKALAVLFVQLLQLAAIALTGLLLGWRPGGGLLAVAASALLIITATFTFTALALLMAGTLRAEATLAGANLVYVLLLIGGAVLVPLSQYPAAVAGVVRWLPSAALADGLRSVLHPGAGTISVLVALAVLLAWAIAGAALTARTFRWD